MIAIQGAATDASAEQTGGSFVACGVRIDVSGFAGSVDAILSSPHNGGRAIHLCNAYTLSLAKKDPGYADLLNRGDFNFPDGKPVAMLAKHLGLTSKVERVGGPDLMEAAIDRGRSLGLRHYFYGSTQNNVESLCQRLSERYPGTTIVGVEAPPFRPLSTAERNALIRRVRAASPDVVWVGLGTPKQDQFVDEFRGELGATLVAVGAAFEFLAGVKRRAPTIVQNLGLEWAFRLATEPRRLWRRYLFGSLTFLSGIASDWRSETGLTPIHGKRGKPEP